MGFITHKKVIKSEEIALFNKIMSKSPHKEKFQNLFGSRLKFLREERGLSLREVAQNCDLDYSDIGKYEKGEVSVQLKTIYELAKGLNVHPKELFNFDFLIPKD